MDESSHRSICSQRGRADLDFGGNGLSLQLTCTTTLNIEDIRDIIYLVDVDNEDDELDLK